MKKSVHEMEVEVRIGRIVSSRFVPGISRRAFEEIRRAVVDAAKPLHIEVTKAECEDAYSTNGVRTRQENGRASTVTKKITHRKNDTRVGAYCVRYAESEERPALANGVLSFTRKKSVTRCRLRCMLIEFSEVVGPGGVVYELEAEGVCKKSVPCLLRMGELLAQCAESIDKETSQAPA